MALRLFIAPGLRIALLSLLASMVLASGFMTRPLRAADVTDEQVVTSMKRGIDFLLATSMPPAAR